MMPLTIEGYQSELERILQSFLEVYTDASIAHCTKHVVSYRKFLVRTHAKRRPTN